MTKGEELMWTKSKKRRESLTATPINQDTERKQGHAKQQRKADPQRKMSEEGSEKERSKHKYRMARVGTKKGNKLEESRMREKLQKT